MIDLMKARASRNLTRTVSRSILEAFADEDLVLIGALGPNLVDAGAFLDVFGRVLGRNAEELARLTSIRLG